MDASDRRLINSGRSIQENQMKRAVLAIFIVMLTVQGCDQSVKEDVKDVGQDIKNTVNKATD